MTEDEEAFFIAMAYAGSFIILGASWWRACIVAGLIAVLFGAGWGKRWITKGVVGVGTLAALVFLQALPQPSQWPATAKSFHTASIAKGE